MTGRAALVPSARSPGRLLLRWVLPLVLASLWISDAIDLSEGAYRLHDLVLDAFVSLVIGGILVWVARVLDRADAERRKAELDIREAQRIEAVGILAGGVAHDFNNLLLAIRGYSELALGEVGEEGEGDRLRAHLSQIATASNKAADLAGQLLAFGRKQMLRPTVVDLNELVRRLEPRLRSCLGAQSRLVVKPDPCLGAVEVDAVQIEQAIVNMVLNSRDAMPDGGELTIETANVPAGLAPMVDLRPGSHIALSVADTGCGMDPETQALMFDPFFSTKEQGKGTGLGLSTAYGIVKQSGGEIITKSEPGRGTRLTVYLPCVEQPAAKSGAAGRPVATRRLSTSERDGVGSTL